jgi:uncharacterized RDD family membrane protein YckC
MSILGLSITDTKPVIQGAGFWIRVLARVVDTAYGSLLGFFAGFFGAIVLLILQNLSLVEHGWLLRVSQAKWGLWLASLAGSIAYQTLCEGLCGASIGKLVCGLRVLSEDCSPCDLWQGLIRSLSYFIDGLVFGLVGYLEMTKTLMEQRHGDHWAKTLVVRTSQVPEASKPSGWRYLLAIALGSAAWGFFLIATYIVLGLAD